MEYDTTSPSAVPTEAPASDDAKQSSDLPDSEKALISQWEKKIVDARVYWDKKKVWKEIKENMQFAARGADEIWLKDGKYVVPILPRHINISVGALYARNPTATAKRRPYLGYKLWDERPDSLQAAMQTAALGDPGAMAIIQEVLAVRSHNLMMDRMARTLEILFAYYVNEQSANFKQQLKAAVRRTKVCKVSFVKLGYQRILEKRPEITAQIEDVTSKIAAMQATLEDISEGEVDDYDARMAELKFNLLDLQSQESLLVREGLIFDFPRANEITIDPNCRHLKSFSGAEWISHDFDMTPAKIEEIYEVDVGSSYKQYKTDGTCYADKDSKGDKTVGKVHEVYHKRDRLVFTICEGYSGWLKPPAAPDLKIERFYPLFPLVFNEVELDDNIYPASDVEQAKHIQLEFNRKREAIRQHRIAAKPWYVEGIGLEEKDKEKISNHDEHEVVTLASLAPGQDVNKLLQRGPTAPIDPNLYETSTDFDDLQHVVGSQEADLGGTSGSTATESSIAENSRSVSNADNVDDLDEMLTELARAAGQVLLTECSKETVIEIVGPGAVWPDMPETREQVAKDLELEIQAGSTGRPNQALELANIERATPLLVQLPGINPLPIGKKYAFLLGFEPTELISENVPSIQALNALVAKAANQPSTGNPATDPSAQGPQGANNTPGPQQNQNEPGPQPAFPAPKPNA